MAEYIEREAAMNFEVDSVLLAPGALQPFMDGMALYADHIKHIPAADVVPVVHGRWKPYDLTWGRSVYACTACEGAFEVPTEMGKPIYAYCPNCGALMDKDGDGDV